MDSHDNEYIERIEKRLLEVERILAHHVNS